MRYVNAQGEEVQGVRRRPPAYYIGETYRGRPTVTGDVERWPNGALVGTRDKGARRLIRKAFGRALSRIEQHVLKARDARLEIERLSTNGHEARRYWDKALALHVAKPTPMTRSQARAKFRPYDNREAEQQLRVKRMEGRITAAKIAAERSTQETLEKATGEKTLRTDEEGNVPT